MQGWNGFSLPGFLPFQLHHWSPQEAIEAIAKIRPHILIRRKQVQVLESFHKDVTAGTTAERQ